MTTSFKLSTLIGGLIVLVLPIQLNAQDLRARNIFLEGQIISSASGRFSDGDLYVSSEKGDFTVVGVWSGQVTARREETIRTAGVFPCIVSGDVPIKKGERVMSDGKGGVTRWTEPGFPIGYAAQDWNGSSSLLSIRLTL
jgi:hypothetical protein